MPPKTLKRRRNEDAMRGKLPKKHKQVKRQKHYHSSSEDEGDGGALDAPEEFAPVYLESSDEETHKPVQKAPKSILKPAPPPKEDIGSSEIDLDDSADESGEEADSESDASYDSLSDASTNNPRRVKKRNDPEAFANSISKILNTKLTTQKRSEPILSRSKDAQEVNKSVQDRKLTEKAHGQLLAEKKAKQEKGRVKDVLALDDPNVSTAATTAKEKELRRTAQKGVIRLFNAVRAAQVKGEKAEKEAKAKGMVGVDRREDKVKEMSKQGFLDMITSNSQQKAEDSTKQKEGSVEV